MLDNSKHRVLRIVAAAIKTQTETLDDNAAIGDVTGWDSLAQLDILASVEQEFGVSIEPEDAIDLTSVKALVQYVQRHA